MSAEETGTAMLARFAVGCAPPAGELAEATRRCLRDHLANALAGHDRHPARIAEALAEPGDAAGIYASRRRTSAARAAFVNAVRAHVLIRDDMHVESVCHIGTVVLPAILALAEREDATGGDILAAIVAGYAVMARVGAALAATPGFTARFRPTGVSGTAGAAAAAARLLRLDAATAASAIALAVNQAAGLNEWPHAGGEEIYLHPAHAARAGVEAVALAAAGLRGSASVIEGRAGILAGFGRGPDVIMAPDAGAILSVRHKPVPACNYVQTPVMAALALVARECIAAAAIEGVEIVTFAAALGYPGCDHPGPFDTVEQIKMSLQASVAVALITGSAAEAGFLRNGDREIARLAAATRLVNDPALTAAYPARQGAGVRLRLTGGRIVETRLEDVPWLDAAAVTARFRDEAEVVLGPKQAQTLDAAISALGTTGGPSGRSLGRLLARSVG